MRKIIDYVALWEKYQREGVPQKKSIEHFCVMNGYTYKQFEQWYKTNRIETDYLQLIPCIWVNNK